MGLHGREGTHCGARTECLAQRFGRHIPDGREVRRCVGPTQFSRNQKLQRCAPPTHFTRWPKLARLRSPSAQASSRLDRFDCALKLALATDGIRLISRVGVSDRRRFRAIKNCVASEAPIPKDLALCLYRIAQEALRNVIKHSGAGEAYVELRRTREGLELRVRDRGIGFDVDRYEYASWRTVDGHLAYLQCGNTVAAKFFDEALEILPDHREPWEYAREEGIFEALHPPWCKEAR